ncbi:MAG: hypothetical protein VZR02_07910 [Lachnospiraceae bacterium]|nr:hypothetical protein [Lachnospiraceae bacterium]
MGDDEIILPHFPLIRKEEGHLFYGGDQHWYRNRFHRLAGCAPTSGANLAAFMRIGTEPDVVTPDGDPVWNMEHFLDLMDTMYRYLKPGMRGFPHSTIYQEKFLAYAADRGVTLSTTRRKGWPSEDEAFSFVKENIDEGRPVILLVLKHSVPEIEEDTWHWMTITGYSASRREIHLSNYGRRQWMRVDAVFMPGPENDVKLLTFERQE